MIRLSFLQQQRNYFGPKVFIAILPLFFAAEIFGFGKNKVEYEYFKWNCYRVPHFEVYFSQNQGVLPAIATQWIENDFEALRRDFSFAPKDKIPVILYGSPNSFAQTNVISDILPEGVGGFTTQIKNRIVVPFDGSYDELRHVLHHELVHGFQYSILFEQFGSSLLTGADAQLPLWFAEGLAEYLSMGWNTESDMFLMDATIFGSIGLPGPELGGYMAYKGGQSFFEFLAESRGEKRFSQFLARFKEVKNVERSFKEVYGKSPEELGEEWRTELKRLYWPEIGRRAAPAKFGIALTAHEKDRDNFNLKPRISPDGTKVAYFSDLRDYTRILVCTAKGEIFREVGQSGYAGSFESFHPFRSGLCWSPGSDKLAFVSSNNGKDELRIVDINKKKLLKAFIPDLASAVSPDWSPNGRDIVFCGIDRGYCDLYVYNSVSGSCTRLTNDIFSEADPRYTRDGRGIVFARQDTSGAAERSVRKAAPPVQLWYLDLADLHCVQLTASPGNKKAPCFSPDGKFIMYVSDRNGIDNIYVAPFKNPDSAKALTDVIGGCSSPDWAKDSAAAVYCLFQKGGWDIWRVADPMNRLMEKMPEKTKWMESCDDTAKPFFSPEVAADSASGPKKKEAFHGPGRHAAPLTTPETAADEETGISERDTTKAHPDTTAAKSGDSVAVKKTDWQKKEPPAAAAVPVSPPQHVTLNFDTLSPRPYRLTFTPDIVSVGLGTDAYYGYGVSGQIVAVFSDLMGNHQIAVMGDVEGNIADYTHLFASYFNLEHKVNFGLAAFYNREYTATDIFGDSLYFDTDAGAMATLRFPFSMYSRIDVEGFYENLFRVPYLSETTDNGSFVNDTTRRNRTINIFMPSISYTYDDILWGITGPLNGLRAQARVVMSPPVKLIDASFASFDVDVRHYWHILNRFVWANRLAFGASIPLRNEAPSRKFFLGGDENWFLYDFNTAAYQQNVNNFFYSDIIVPFRGWNYLDIIGTKFAVVNTEFRFPFLKEMTLVWPLPLTLRYVNGAVFTDIGNAWNPEEQFKNVPLPKNIYGGVGGGLRANLGIFVLRWDRAWKTDFATFFGPWKDYWSLGAEF
ncbi:MAG TPA: BamA/TamA family outer membrane protein [Chitinivibrionales bacterium]|nr:BamA/TamA family outer membrane protein [Chitinivibrionales bacterium]